MVAKTGDEIVEDKLMKIVSTFIWPGSPTPVFVTDIGDVWTYTEAGPNGLNVKRFPLIDGATGQPVIPARGLEPGSKIEVLFVSGLKEHVWKPFVVEFIGATTFQYRESVKILGTLAYTDEGKHWRLI